MGPNSNGHAQNLHPTPQRFHPKVYLSGNILTMVAGGVSSAL